MKKLLIILAVIGLFSCKRKEPQNGQTNGGVDLIKWKRKGSFHTIEKWTLDSCWNVQIDTLIGYPIGSSNNEAIAIGFDSHNTNDNYLSGMPVEQDTLTASRIDSILKTYNVDTNNYMILIHMGENRIE